MTDFRERTTFLDSIVLNTIQKSAVEYNDGPQLVFAGAGTGKTRVLTAKIAFLIGDVGLHPNNIFAATFTNKAASEMRERVEKLINISCRGLWIGTFHSLCVRILRMEGHHLGYKSSFSIYDSSDQLSLLKKVMKELAFDDRAMQPKRLLNKISNYKNACKTFRDLDGTGISFFEREVIGIYGSYQKALKKAQAMDFDDLITNTFYLFRDFPEILINYQNQFKHVLVDEYQDTNMSQFNLVKLLAKKHNNIFVVGDDDQSIYSWRGARVENILSFDRIFPGTRVFKLEQNYRSTQSILNFANAVISNNLNRADKKLWTTQRSDKDVIVTRYRDDRLEAQSVAEKISTSIARGVKACEIAILFRTNAQSRAFEDVLIRRNIPYILVGGTSFYERKEIKDCLAYLRLLVNPSDTISCDRIINVPARGIGAKSLENVAQNAKKRGMSMFAFILAQDFESVSTRAKKGLTEFAKIFHRLIDLVNQGVSPQDIMEEMLTITEYIEMLEIDDSEESRTRLENVNELVNALTIWNEENPDKTIIDFLEEISLTSDVDKWKRKDISVNLMTLHAAKGLEFHTTYLVGLEDGLIPSKQNFENEQAMEEECRLFYVGSTRAMDTLECSYANSRMRFGAILPMEPSRFLGAVPSDLFRSVDASVRIYKTQKTAYSSNKPDPQRFQRRKVIKAKSAFDEYSQETIQYRMGQIVTHNKYGQGKILSINGFGVDMKLTILFTDGSRKQLMAKFANLQTR